MTDPVVVGVDGSERSLRALIWAANDAALHGCPLLVAHVLPGWEADFPFFPPGRAQGLSRRGAEILAEAVAIAKENHPDLEVESDQVSGSPAEVLRGASERARCVVLGARGEGGLGNLLMGSVSLQVAGHASCPVVVVGAITTGHRRILVGTDGSEHSAAAMEFAFEEASLRNDRVHALHAWSMPATPESSEAGPSVEEAEADHRRQLDAQLAPLRQRYPGVETETTLVRGRAVDELVRASDRADLAVVGSRGKGGFHGLALGSVSHGLLHYGICPVAVVRPRPRHTPTT
ncbi:universal stress protein [Streptomyces sp. FH025]|uniref:universal stress protein n=1 Tax=Streptomyces sp. FH025 TaxID=2815937 RepID=UPI001A9CDCC6|nr:universal stress protein [Streptomyces sp. FH025]MBO1413084.1 universal stress protein [Streptomyces sp. FH025]